MVVTLTPDLENLVREKVASGDYRDETDVIARALKLLDDQDRDAALQAALDEGEADLREGRYIDLDSDEKLDAFFASL
ncbi:MAG TPA: type II toxin-antitoxin system ParD family antitoxin [Caulobacteraceae bacterium]|jgi:antitoxin ParD1/3/4|nr:type II toxin-antitoxin system ParD family antitoxin [Caulobacteraceae bacterium]